MIAPRSPYVGHRGFGLVPNRVADDLPVVVPGNQPGSGATVRVGLPWWVWIGGLAALVGLGVWGYGKVNRDVEFGVGPFGTGRYKARRHSRKARRYEAKAAEYHAAAKALSAKYGISKKAALAAAASQTKKDTDFQDSFDEVIRGANRIAGSFTGSKGGRPTRKWRDAYTRLRDRVESESGIALPAAGTSEFGKLMRERDS